MIQIFTICQPKALNPYIHVWYNLKFHQNAWCSIYVRIIDVRIFQMSHGKLIFRGYWTEIFKFSNWPFLLLLWDFFVKFKILSVTHFEKTFQDCAVRIRYNLSSNDYPEQFDPADTLTANRYMQLENNPVVQLLPNLELQLALNTDWLLNIDPIITYCVF